MGRAIIWKNVPGFSGYQASVDGRIRHGKKELVTRYRPGEGVFVRVAANQRRFDLPVNALVCMAHHGLPPHRWHTVVNFDGDRRNNHADNLWYVETLDYEQLMRGEHYVRPLREQVGALGLVTVAASYSREWGTGRPPPDRGGEAGQYPAQCA